MNPTPSVLHLGNTKLHFDVQSDATRQYHEVKGAALESIKQQDAKAELIAKQRLSYTLITPTNLNEVNTRLHMLGQPISIDGETHAQKCYRLRGLMLDMAVEGKLEKFEQIYLDLLGKNQEKLNLENKKKGADFVKRQKISAFLTEVLDPDSLHHFRLKMVEYSMASAQIRLKKEKQFRKKLFLILDGLKKFQQVSLKSPATISLAAIPIEFRPYVKRAHKKLEKFQNGQEMGNNDQNGSNDATKLCPFTLERIQESTIVQSDDIFSTLFDDFMGNNNAVFDPFENNTNLTPTTITSSENPNPNTPDEDLQDGISDVDYQVPTYLYWQEKLMPNVKYNNRRTYTLTHLSQISTLRSYQPQVTYKADTRVISCSAISNSNKELITGSWSGNLKLWDLNKLSTFPASMTPSSILIGHTGRIIDVCVPDQNSMSRELRPLVRTDHGICAVSSGTDGILIWPRIIRDNDGAAGLAEYRRENYIKMEGSGPILGSENRNNSQNNTATTLTTDPSIKLEVNINEDFDEDDDESTYVNSQNTYITHSLMSTHQKEQHQLLNSRTVYPISRLNFNKNQSSHTNRITIHPNNEHIFASSQDQCIKIYSLETQQCVLNQFGHSAPTQGVSIHQDGSLYVSTDIGGNARVWDTRTGRSLMALEGHNREVLCCSFGKDSQSSHIIATGGSDNTIKLWDLRIRKCMYTIPVHKRHVVDVSFNKTGEYLCSSSFDHTIGLFSLPTMSIVGSLYGHGNKVSRVHWWDEEINRTNSGNFDVMDDGVVDTTADQLLNDNIEGKIISTSFDTTFKIWG